MRHVQTGYRATCSTRKALAARHLLAASLVLMAVHSAGAQRTKHYHYEINQPTGAIGAMQVARGVAPPGYVQPTKIIVPAGAMVSVADDCSGTFSAATQELQVGLIVGQPYRFKVTSIPRFETQAIYPSIELIGRLHPPRGLKDRFPIPVEITQQDLELAIGGQMVVRVIYLENPKHAFPEAETEHQRSIDVMSDEDPLQVADELGRPMAILRLGSRAPANGMGDAAFLFGAPPVSESRPVLYVEQPVPNAVPKQPREMVDESAIPDPLDAEARIPLVEPPSVQANQQQLGQGGAPIVSRDDPFPRDLVADSPSDSN